MASATREASSILYQNTECDIILIDIPSSIAASQGRTDVLLSTAPLEAPIEPREDYRPKKTTEAQGSVNTTHHAEYKALAEHALSHIQAHVSGPWCAPRQIAGLQRGKETVSAPRGAPDLPAVAPRHSSPGRFSPVARGGGIAMPEKPLVENEELMETDDQEKELEFRMREWAAWSERKGDDTAFNLQQMMSSLGAATSATEPAAGPQKWTMSYQPARESTSSTQAAETVPQVGQTKQPWMSTFHNPHHYSLSLTLTQNILQPTQPGQEYRFTIPPRSTLFLSDSTASETFRASFRELTDEYTLPRHFDLVLLDPPWPNRSAKRKGAYEQVGGMPYLKKMLLSMDIDSYLEHNALVGVWITNKAALRDHVLGPGGLFETWNVGLVEEWIWIKTTTKGEPMFDMDSEMRKPYEILLLGRAAPNAWTTMAHAPSVRRRVVAAVPDIHSRKPCLKPLLEPYLRSPAGYSALEVFARYLVSGWTAWGNEAFKFNWDGYWAPAL
ncbi:MT-A70-domain-containing protein [Decorospora gaudefroyi]|uniref:MT-A70-domain-containing protein n=1 Tax=Decorospora gaudefroyi TaxID=184978 RepID=A0A6A5KF04_9PLEO|nr:MT-A70-domain-containing protein [Decorospora gaudefroyi]